MRVASVDFAPAAAGAEWLPMRSRVRADFVEALVPPGSSGPSLGDAQGRLCWMVVAWDSPSWHPRRPPTPGAYAALTVSDALVWVGRRDAPASWVIESTAAYVGYLFELLFEQVEDEGEILRSTVERFGDPALDLLAELTDAAMRFRSRRHLIDRSLALCVRPAVRVVEGMMVDRPRVGLIERLTSAEQRFRTGGRADSLAS
jgi:hypothetical protein